MSGHGPLEDPQWTVDDAHRAVANAQPAVEPRRRHPRMVVCGACQDVDGRREQCGECGQTGESRWLFGQPRTWDIGYMGC